MSPQPQGTGGGCDQCHRIPEVLTESSTRTFCPGHVCSSTFEDTKAPLLVLLRVASMAALAHCSAPRGPRFATTGQVARASPWATDSAGTLQGPTGGCKVSHREALPASPHSSPGCAKWLRWTTHPPHTNGQGDSSRPKRA